ncbi:MAG: HD domain-containing phosphohydrolase [Pseudomonadota bacterium]
MAAKPPERAKEKILVIDDERNLLEGIRRQLHKRFKLVLAENGDEGIAALQAQGPFAVVVCDMNMPGKTGIEVLAEIGELSPDTVRIMLTGQTDLDTAMNAVNQGNIFRFFTKPCPAEMLAAGLTAALEQYRLVTAERDLLNKTLSGSIKVLTDVLAMMDPDSFGRTERARHWMRKVTGALGLQRHRWKLEMAAMLAPIGFAALPPEVAKKARANLELTQVEREMVEASAETAHKLICHIPRLQEVASYVLYQGKNIDGTGFPHDDKAGNDIPIGARIVRILSDLALSMEKGQDLDDTLALMGKYEGIYDLKLLKLIGPIILEDQAVTPTSGVETMEIKLQALCVGDVLLTPILDLETEDLILAKGAAVTELYIKRLGNLRRIRKLTETVRIRRSSNPEAEAKAS